MKKIKNYFVLFIFSIVFLSGCKEYIRQNLFPAPKDQIIPEIGNDKLIEVQNEDRISKGLLSKSGDSLVVIYHGNGSLISNEVIAAKYFYENNFSVLLVEYPSYGISSKYEVSEDNIYSDAEALLNYLKQEKLFTNDNIYLLGRSLGCGVAVEMAKRGYGSKLVLITPFTSIPDMAKRNFPEKMVDKLIVDKFSNIDKAQDINLPVLIIHGDKDTTTPYEMSVRLSKEFPDAELITLDTDQHRNIYEVIDSDTWDKIKQFLIK